MLRSLSQYRSQFNRYRQRRRIYIVPTRLGYSYGVLLIVLLLGAINYSNSLGHLLSFLLASLGWVGMYHSYRNIRSLQLLRVDAEPVFCGQTAQLQLFLAQRGNQQSYQIEIARKHGEIRSWRPFAFLRGYQVLAKTDLVTDQQHSRVILPLVTQQRGWMRVGKIRLASTFPLGLFNCWTSFDTAPYQLLVYPKPIGSLSLPFDDDENSQAAVSNKPGMDDFSGFQRWRDGDPIHAVAWKALARDDIMRIKQFSSPHSRSVSLDWQQVNALTDTEAKLSQLCSWVLQAESENLNYSLILPYQRIEAGHGEAHCHRCLKALAIYENR